ncbi:hypothetical protein HRG_014912 [Hirsutella rhossiliensis]
MPDQLPRYLEGLSRTESRKLIICCDSPCRPPLPRPRHIQDLKEKHAGAPESTKSFIMREIGNLGVFLFVGLDLVECLLVWTSQSQSEGRRSEDANPQTSYSLTTQQLPPPKNPQTSYSLTTQQFQANLGQSILSATLYTSLYQYLNKTLITITMKYGLFAIMASSAILLLLTPSGCEAAPPPKQPPKQPPQPQTPKAGTSAGGDKHWWQTAQKEGLSGVNKEFGVTCFAPPKKN